MPIQNKLKLFALCNPYIVFIQNYMANHQILNQMLFFKLILPFFLILVSFQQTKFPKIIWTYWTGGEIPYFSKLCLENMKQMTKKDGWVINIVNDVNIYEYIQDDEYLDYIINHPVLSQYLANRADIVRLFLMYQNGGVWLDISTILTEDLTWLDKLAINPDIYNRQQYGNYNQYPDVLLFLSEHFGNKKQEIYWKTGQRVLAKPGFQTWFIACIPKATLLYQWKRQFTQYYLKDYSVYFDKGVNQGIYQRNLDYNSYMTTGGALQNVVQTKQKQIDNKTPYFSGIQYAVHYYKLWTMWSQTGPLIFDYSYIVQTTVFITKYSMDYLKEEGRYPKYFVKTIHRDSIQIDLILNKIMSEYSTKKERKDTQINCYSPISIAKGSIVDIFVLTKLQKDKYKLIQFIDYKQYHKKCWDPVFYVDLLAIRFFQISPFIVVTCFLMYLTFYKNQIAKKMVNKK